MPELTDTDPLTGAVSRSAFLMRLEAELQQASAKKQPLSLLMLDLDNYHRYNHNFGHDVGDALIQQLVQLLRTEVGGVGNVARYGGDEFTVLLPFMDKAEAVALAERMRVAVVNNSWMHRPMTISIGVASVTLATTDANDLVRDADEALHQAKLMGRNRVIA